MVGVASPAPNLPRRLAGRHVLLVQCPDVKGVVAAVSGYLAENDCSITEAHHFNDPMTGRFFMRTVFVRETGRQRSAASA